MKNRDVYTGGYASELTEAARLFRARRMGDKETRVELPESEIERINALEQKLEIVVSALQVLHMKAWTTEKVVHAVDALKAKR